MQQSLAVEMVISPLLRQLLFRVSLWAGFHRLAIMPKFQYHLMTAVFAALTPAPVAACGVALALAIDVSGSVDGHEYELQMGGLAAALRDGLVADALIAEKAAILVVHWSGQTRQSIVVPWTRVLSVADAEALAVEVQSVPRSWRNYSTGIGEALAFTANEFGDVADCKRRVIDVSGDGTSNEGAPPEDIKEALAAAGYVINGLAIEGETANLTEYYRDKVIAGPNSFVLPAFGFRDYPEKIRKKLIREVTKQVAVAE
jgi:Ca-activated chloride channel family protein